MLLLPKSLWRNKFFKNKKKIDNNIIFFYNDIHNEELLLRFT